MKSFNIKKELLNVNSDSDSEQHPEYMFLGKQEIDVDNNIIPCRYSAKDIDEDLAHIYGYS